MDAKLQEYLAEHILALADDQLILGHRDSEWCGQAPILEEDIAFANLALDEIGHANLWYGLVAELRGEDPETTPDRLAFFRPLAEYRCAQIVELPKGDWAFSMLRQYLLDMAEGVRLEALEHSTYAPAAEAAAKLRKEELYHQRHTQAWVKRLGLGTEESHTRLQRALDELWPYTPQLFAPLPGEAELVAAGIWPASDELYSAWQARVLPQLGDAALSLPALPAHPPPERTQHTPHLPVLLNEMQSVARLEPDGTW